MRTIRDNPKDETKVFLLYANKTFNDILLKKELDAYTSDPRFTINYTLDNVIRVKH